MNCVAGSVRATTTTTTTKPEETRRAGKEGTSARPGPPLRSRPGSPNPQRRCRPTTPVAVGSGAGCLSGVAHGSPIAPRQVLPTSFSLCFLQSNSMTSRTRTLHTHAHVMTKVKKRKTVATPARGRGRRGWQRRHLHSTRAPPRTHSLGRTGLSQSPPSREEEGKGGGVEGLIAWPSSGALSSRASSSSSGGKRWPCVSPASSPFDSAQCRPGLPSCWGSPPP